MSTKGYLYMAKSKPSKKSKKAIQKDSGTITAAAALLFAGMAGVGLGSLQTQGSLELFLVGFGTAFIFIGAVLLGMSVKSK